MSLPDGAKTFFEEIKKDAGNLVNTKGEINVDVFINPKKYAICLPVNKIVADYKVSKEGVDYYKLKIKNKEKINPIIVVKHPHKDKYAVLDGHHRYYAYVEMGKKEINCALAGDYSNVIFYLTKKGYLQPSIELTNELRRPAKRLHENLKEFLKNFLEQ
jgi:uncharacterized ParB-like nuclease family protein